MISKRIYIVFVFLFVLVTNAFANVNVTSGGNLNLCVGTTYTTIGNITISEGGATDFSISGSVQTYEINVPSNFEFNPGNGSVTASGGDITFSAVTVTSTKITLLYFVNATATTDNFVLNGIQIRATNSSGSQNLTRTGGNAVQAGNNAGDNKVHAQVTAAQAFVNLSLGSLSTLCINAGDKTLNGGNPGGGTYSGTSVSSGTTFSPSSAGAGTFVITYTATQNGCVGTATANIKVNPKPVVTFFGLASSYCSNADDAPLTGFPSGGTFSGSVGISGNVFKPTVPSVGNKNITYAYTDANGCSDSYTLPTTVIQAPTVQITVNPDKLSYAINDVPVTISGSQSDPSSGGTIYLDGDGVSNSNSLFTPSAAGAGIHTISRTLIAPNGCTASKTKNMTVSGSSNVIIIGLDDKYCEYNVPVNLTTSLGSGIYSGDGISAANSAGTAIFTPSAVHFDGQQQVTVVITLTYGLFTTYTQSVTVYRRPIVKIIQDTVAPNFRTVFCNQDPQVPISVSTFPAGGNGLFSGSQAIAGNNFNPSAATLLGSANPNKVFYNYTDINGCTNKDSVSVVVNEVTTGLDFSGLNSVYCDKNALDTLTQMNGGSKFSGGFFSGVGINGKTFNPAIAAQYNNGAPSQNYTITFTYVNTQKCITTIQKNTQINLSPEVTLGGLSASKEYCYGSDSVSLTGNPSSGASGIGVFSIKVLSSNILDSHTLSGNVFRPNKTTNPGTYRILYKYTVNSSQCTNTDSATVVVHEKPVVTFTNLDSTYCVYDKDVLLNGSPSSLTGSSYTSLSGTAVIPNGNFRISTTGVGKQTIKYTYTDAFGCSGSVTHSTTVYGAPVNKAIKLSTSCEKDLIRFSDLSASLDTTHQAKSFIKTAHWLFDTLNYTNTFKADTSLRLVAGSHKVSYTLTTDKGCFAKFDSTVIIGSYPKTAFTWDKICNKENTKFFNTSTNLVGTITNVVWNFSDGTQKDSIRLSSTVKGDTSHTYANPDTYSVILKAQTDYMCITIDTQKVFILPAMSISSAQPYSNDFNDLVGDWVSSSAIDTVASSWQVDLPNKTIIKSANGAWVTNATGVYNQNEVSYVYSPCFTITDITKPMIRMDIWSATQAQVAGANLQYTVDGTNWIALGKSNESGINWYNNAGNINSRPSGALALDQNGWTGNFTGWKNARHIFDKELGGNKNIRFRVSFAGANVLTTDGFAFDNVWIGDRTRLILAEHFTNNSSAYTKTENTKLNDLVTANLLNNQPKDIVSLQYHTAFPGPDQMNARNIPDAGARSLYYGVTQIPYTCVDGSYFRGSALQIDTNMVNTRSLYDPAFNITLNPNLSSNNVSGSVTIENKIPVSNTVTLYISLLERFVNNIPGANGELNYQWVHAKFLPDAAGTSFPANWSPQSTQNINFNWDFTSANLYDPNKLAMIVFVQDNVTTEIYQTAYKGLGATVATGVFNPTEKTSTVSLYPNPANDFTTVILNGKLSGEYNWVITDELGRTIDQGGLKNETDSFVINTINYANGFYTLRLSNTTDGVKTQKFVVVH